MEVTAVHHQSSKLETMDNYNENKAYRRARKRVKEIKSFYYHLTCYCVVIPILIVINLTFTPEYYWFPFSMCGWGLGLFFHSMEAFKYNPFLSKNWEERKMKEFLEQEKKQEEKFKE